MADETPWTPATVKRAIQLNAYRQTKPAQFEELARLGLTKAYVLMALPPGEMDAFVGQAHEVRTGVVKTPVQMTVKEMMGVVFGEPEAKPAGVQALEAVKRTVRSLGKAVEALLEAVTPWRRRGELLTALEVIAEELDTVLDALPNESLILAKPG